MTEKSAITADRYFISQQLIPDSDVSISHDLLQPIAIVGEKSSLTKALLQHLKQANLDARWVKAISLDASSQAKTVICVQGLAKQTKATQAAEINKQLFLQAKAVANTFSEQAGVFITVQANDQPESVWSMGASGLIKTLKQEWPLVKAKAININLNDHTAEQNAKRIFHELMAGFDQDEIILTDKNERYGVIQQAEAVPSVSKNPLQPKDVVLVTGGAKGITPTCLMELAKQLPLHFILLGRTELENEPDFCQTLLTEQEIKAALFSHSKAQQQALTPQALQQKTKQIMGCREIKQTITQLEALGSLVDYYAVDVQDNAAIKKLTSQVRKKSGKIDAIIHAAGVLADKLIKDKTEAQFSKVFDTKINGLQVLLNATSQDSLKLLCLFSSVAACFGNPGQSDYAMANSVMNQVAVSEQKRRGDACLVKAINWGPWDSGMVTPELRQAFQTRGITLLPLDVGAKMFVQEIQDAEFLHPQVIIGSPLTSSPEQTIEKRTEQKTGKNKIINKQTHAYLFDHIVKDVPVLPACTVLDWFIQTGKALFPDHPIVCKEFKVLKGINFRVLHKQDVELKLEYKKINEQPVVISLLDSEQNKNYQAVIEPETAVPTLNKKDFIIEAKEPWKFSIADIYTPQLLFHGPAFQVIRALTEIGKTGASATVTVTDPLLPAAVGVLDSALQLLRLWGHQYLGKASLPTKIGTCFLLQPLLSNTAYHCYLHILQQSKTQIIADIIFTNSEGKTCAILQHVEHTVY